MCPSCGPGQLAGWAEAVAGTGMPADCTLPDAPALLGPRFLACAGSREGQAGGTCSPPLHGWKLLCANKALWGGPLVPPLVRAVFT